MGNIDNLYKPFELVTVYKKDLANIYNLVLQIKNEINEIEDERIKQINETLNEIFIIKKGDKNG